jgi:hypothetical protein
VRRGHHGTQNFKAGFQIACERVSCWQNWARTVGPSPHNDRTGPPGGIERGKSR